MRLWPSSSLDLSFNLLRSIAPLDDTSSDSPYVYPKLDHLYLIQNKLSKIEGVRHRTNLTYLEYGGNRIRVSDILFARARFKRCYRLKLTVDARRPSRISPSRVICDRCSSAKTRSRRLKDLKG